MNCQEIQALWNCRLDGDLSDDQEHIFAAHLEACTACSNLWQREQEWLMAIAQSEHPREGQDSAAFSSTVMTSWQRRERIGVLARIGAVAAAAAIVLGTWVTWQHPVGELEPHKPIIATVPTPTDPVSVLVQEMGQQIEQQPAQFRRAIQRTASLLDWQRLVGLLPTTPPRPQAPEDAAPEPPSSG